MPGVGQTRGDAGPTAANLLSPGRKIFTLAAISLVLLQWLWHGWLQPNLNLALLLSAPLIIPLPWLFRGSLRAAASLCFVSLIHFLHGVTEVITAPELRTPALLETGLCLSLYAALIMWTAARR